MEQSSGLKARYTIRSTPFLLRLWARMAPSTAVIGNDGSIYFASGTARLVSCCFTFSYGPGSLYALRPDGSLSWNFTTGPIAASEFTRMDLLAIGSDATIYLASEDGNLYAIG